MEYSYLAMKAVCIEINDELFYPGLHEALPQDLRCFVGVVWRGNETTTEASVIQRPTNKPKCTRRGRAQKHSKLMMACVRKPESGRYIQGYPTAERCNKKGRYLFMNGTFFQTFLTFGREKKSPITQEKQKNKEKQ